jgi:hypothetical protein
LVRHHRASEDAEENNEPTHRLVRRGTAAVRDQGETRTVQGLFPVAMCGADFAAHIRKQYDEYGRAIREANIRAQ